MKNTWQLQEAKNRLSTVVEGALHHGPQIITRRGVKTAIVLSVKDYEKLAKPKQNLVDFFKSSPLHGVKIDLTRSKDTRNTDDMEKSGVSIHNPWNSQ